ncbi:MAG: translation initiation factor IF-2 N-terminal domain-containing protein [Anaerotignum faecicola]
MSKIRIYELAKQLGVANKDLVAKINSIGIEAKSHMAMLTEEEAAKVTALYQPKKEKPKRMHRKRMHPSRTSPSRISRSRMGRKRKMTADRTATDLRRKRTTETKAEATKTETKTSRARAIITTITIIITSRAVRITRAHSSRARRTTIKARTKKTKRGIRTARR